MSELPNIPKAVSHKDWRKNQVVDEAKDAKVCENQDGQIRQWDIE